jgi:hypothetical protein
MDQGQPMQRWFHHHRRSRVLGIILLILGLVHAPWPQADFHNVRHHDQPGQVCEYHDHLLRWHPDASAADDVAILHWHWVLPTSGPIESGHSGNGPMLHAYVSGWDATSPDPGPQVTLDSSSRLIDLNPPFPLALEAAPFATPVDRPGLRERLGPLRTFSATFAPRISLASRLQRWSC